MAVGSPKGRPPATTRKSSSPILDASWTEILWKPAPRPRWHPEHRLAFMEGVGRVWRRGPVVLKASWPSRAGSPAGCSHGAAARARRTAPSSRSVANRPRCNTAPRAATAADVAAGMWP